VFKNIWKTYGHYLFIPLIIFFNFLLNWLIRNIEPRFMMASSLDRSVPFLKVFVIPYFLWMIFIIGVTVFLAIKTRKEFIQFSTFIVTGQVICMLIYLIYPNTQNLRPEVMSNDIFSRMILAIYRRNLVANTAPSIHVLYTLATHFGLMKYEPFSKNRYLTPLLYIFTLVSILSTLFIKQHSVMDVLSGIIVSFLLYILIYKEKPDGNKYGFKKFGKPKNIS